MGDSTAKTANRNVGECETVIRPTPDNIPNKWAVDICASSFATISPILPFGCYKY
jgi:hypothetical protein